MSVLIEKKIKMLWKEQETVLLTADKGGRFLQVLSILYVYSFCQ